MDGENIFDVNISGVPNAMVKRSQSMSGIVRSIPSAKSKDAIMAAGNTEL